MPFPHRFLPDRHITPIGAVGDKCKKCKAYISGDQALDYASVKNAEAAYCLVCENCGAYLLFVLRNGKWTQMATKAKPAED